jgi:hypothetical protein
VLSNFQQDVEIPCWTSVAPHITLAGESDLHATLHPSGDGYRGLALPAFQSRTFAIGTLDLNDLSPSLTGGTVGNLRELSKETALGAADLAVTLASAASLDVGSRLVALASAMVAGFYPIYLELCLDAKHRFIEGQRHPSLNVAAPLGFIGPAPGSVTKKGIENIPKAAEYIIAIKGTIEAAVAATCSGMPHAVIIGALL